MKYFVLISGKRKCGKDYLANRLKLELEQMGLSVAVVNISGPLKREYARRHQLDFDELLTSSEYKEKYRSDMVRWGEEIRLADPSFFCQCAVDDICSDVDVCIVADCRRPSDVEYFTRSNSEHSCGICRLRINADESTRIERGWTFVSGIDDAETECALDDFNGWTLLIDNSNTPDAQVKANRQLQEIATFIRRNLRPKTDG